MRIFKIFVGSFLIFILALNLVHYINEGFINGHSTFNGEYFNHGHFAGFSSFFQRISTFHGMQNLYDTMNQYKDTTTYLSTWISDGVPQNDLLAAVLFFVTGVWYVMRILFAILLDIISLFQWFLYLGFD